MRAGGIHSRHTSQGLSSRPMLLRPDRAGFSELSSASWPPGSEVHLRVELRTRSVSTAGRHLRKRVLVGETYPWFPIGTNQPSLRSARSAVATPNDRVTAGGYGHVQRASYWYPTREGAGTRARTKGGRL
jgi:hypothetical protein